MTLKNSFASTFTRAITLLCALAMIMTAASCSGRDDSSRVRRAKEPSAAHVQKKAEKYMTQISIKIQGQTFTIELENNHAAQTLAQDVQKGKKSIAVSPYGGFELVGEYAKSLPTSDVRQQAVPGDVMLYQGNKLVFFYGTNSWEYTKIGHIADPHFTKILKNGVNMIELQ